MTSFRDRLRAQAEPSAVEELFGRTGLAFTDLDLVELNQAFAVQVPAVFEAA